MIRRIDKCRKVSASEPIPKLMEFFPWNLAFAVLTDGYEYTGDDLTEMQLKVADIHVNRFLEVISEFTEKEQKVLHMRFCDGMNYAAVGKAINVSRERSRQIEFSAFQKLKTPVCMKRWMKVDPVIADRLIAERSRLAAENHRLRHSVGILLGRAKDFDGVTETVNAIADGSGKLVEDITLDEMMGMGLSVRSYNCLARAGVKCMGDLKQYDFNKLMGIRNLGKGSALEIMMMMEKHGLVVDR